MAKNYSNLVKKRFKKLEKGVFILKCLGLI